MALNRMNFSNASLAKQLLLLLLLFVMAMLAQGFFDNTYTSITDIDEKQGVKKLHSEVNQFVSELSSKDPNIINLQVLKESKELGKSLSPELRYYYLFNQIGYNTLCFLIVGLIYRWLMNKEKGVMPDLNVRNPLLLFVSVFLLIASLPLIQESVNLNENLGLNTLAEQFGFDYTKNGIKRTLLTYSVFSPQGALTHVIMFSGIAIIPSIGEELFFRGGMQKQLQIKGIEPHLSIFIVALTFALIHMEFTAFFYRFLLGVLLGYVYFWSASIWPSIIIHFCNNALAYFSYIAVSSVDLPEDFASQGITFSQLLMSVFSSGFLLFIFYQTYRRNQLEDSI